MPDENNNNNNAGAGDGGTIEEPGAGQGQGQGGNEGANGGAGDAGAGQGQSQNASGNEDTITISKSELEQIKSDRDNYKEGLLRKKADERDLKGGQGAGNGKGASDAGDGGKGNIIDETKINETATAAANKVFRDASEKGAKRSFLKRNPEYVDDAQWLALVSNLTFKGGEVTEAEIMDRMNAALLEHKRSTGKLEEYLKSEADRARREGRIQGQIDSAGSMGGTGDRNEAGRGTGNLSEKGKEMARAMHTDPEKVEKVDTSKDNVIDVLL